MKAICPNCLSTDINARMAKEGYCSIDFDNENSLTFGEFEVSESYGTNGSIINFECADCEKILKDENDETITTYEAFKEYVIRNDKNPNDELLTELANKLNELGFTDMVDASPEISLLEYGAMRNPGTNFMLRVCPIAVADKEYNYSYHFTTVTLEEVREALEDADEGFYSWAGYDKENALKTLSNDFLALYIQDLENYSLGTVMPSSFHALDSEAIVKVFEEAKKAKE